MEFTEVASLDIWKKRLAYDENRYGPWPHDCHSEALGYIYQYALREKQIVSQGYPIITLECLTTLTKILSGHTVLDCGAGSGYLVYHLRRQGIDIEGIVLPNNVYGFAQTPVEGQLIVGDYLTHDLSPYTAFVISWPDYGSDAGFALLQRLPAGALLVYQGEIRECCATDDFFDYLDEAFDECISDSLILNRTHIQYSGIHDIWKVYIKR